MNELFLMAMSHCIHELGEVGDNFHNLDPFTLLIFYQIHDSAVMTVAHLNVKLIVRTP